MAVFPGWGDSIRSPQWGWSLIGSTLILFFHRRALLDRNGFPLSLAPWLAFIFVYAAFGEFPLNSYRILGAPLLVSCAAWSLWKSGENYGRVCRIAIAGTTFFQILFGLLQYFGKDPLFTRAQIDGLQNNLPGGFTGLHTTYGILLAWLVLFWLLERKWIIAASCAFLLCLTKSSFAMAALSCACLWALACAGYKKTAASISVALGLTAGIIFSLSLDQIDAFLFPNGRLETWVLAIRAWRDRPWFGYGIGSFSRDFHRYHQGQNTIPWIEAHNEWIELLFNTGIFGICLLMPFVIHVVVRAWKLPASPGKNLALGTLLILALDSFGSFPFQLAPFACLGIYSLTWIFAAYRQ